jgi:hypothetical protein
MLLSLLALKVKTIMTIPNEAVYFVCLLQSKEGPGIGCEHCLN